LSRCDNKTILGSRKLVIARNVGNHSEKEERGQKAEEEGEEEECSAHDIFAWKPHFRPLCSLMALMRPCSK